MTSVPDDQQPQQPSLGGLRRRYPDWTIGFDDSLHVYFAELRQADGAVRFLAGHDLPELAARLEVATAVAP
jgi:hypothetical protein